jgi:uncharacterized membrane protein
MAAFVQKIVVHAPVERAWGVLADLERWPEWTASMRSVRALGGTPPGAGARYRVEQPKLQPAVFTITEWRPPQTFTWHMGSPGLSAVAVHTLTPVPEGCELELRLEYGGLLGGLVAWLAGGLTRDYMRLEAEGLKRRSERGA